MTAREWRLEFPPPAEFVTANSRTAHRWDRNRPHWRARSATAAQQANLPKNLARVRIDIVIAPEHNRRDHEAYRPTCKALVDGLGPPFFRKPSGKSKGAAAPGYRLIRNDSVKHLDGEYLHVVDAEPPLGKVTIHIVDLTHVPPGRTWTPTIHTATGQKIRTKRACNGCDALLGDVTNEEIEAAMWGRPLPDVRGECPNCNGDIRG